jgi:alanyl-tRNA synthetase
VLHKGNVASGSVKVGSSVKMSVDYQRRSKIAPNHSFTHILNFALRKVLGGDVDQKGSLCDDEKLRFDFTAKGALSSAQLCEVEELCREQIAAKRAVDAEVVPLEKAMAINGLRAVFGEQYPDPVRVVSMGNKVSAMVAAPAEADWLTGSVELCGGTHIQNTAEAQSFAVVQEEAVAKGIRRITAVTREAAAEAMAAGDALVQRLEDAAKIPKAELGPVLTALKQDLDGATMSYGLKGQLRVKHEALTKEYMAEKKKMAAEQANVAIASVTKELEAMGSEAKVAVLEVDVGGDGKLLQSVMKAAQKAAPTLAICLGTVDEAGKGSVLMAAPDGGKGALKANEWLKEALDAAGGRGGGKADSAQGQVPDGSKMKQVFAAAKAFAEGNL